MTGVFHLNSKFISKTSFPLHGWKMSCVNHKNVNQFLRLRAYLIKKLKAIHKPGSRKSIYVRPREVFKSKFTCDHLSFVDYQHLQKYFYNWSITLNYYFIFKINIRGDFIWKCSRSGHILKIMAVFDIG